MIAPETDGRRADHLIYYLESSLINRNQLSTEPIFIRSEENTLQMKSCLRHLAGNNFYNRWFTAILGKAINRSPLDSVSSLTLTLSTSNVCFQRHYVIHTNCNHGNALVCHGVYYPTIVWTTNRGGYF